MTQRRQRVCGLARLADDHGHAAFRQRRLAIAEFRGDLDLDRDAGDLLHPDLGDMGGIIGGATGDDGQVRHGGPIDGPGGAVNPVALGRQPRAQRAGDGRRLLVDLLGHEMAVATLVGQDGVQLDHMDRAHDRVPGGIVDAHGAAGDDRPVAFLEITDPVRHRRQRDGIRADEGLALAKADDEGRATPGADQQILLALEQEAQRIGAAQSRDGGGRGVSRREPACHQRGTECGDDLGISLRFDAVALLGQIGLRLGTYCVS